MKWIWGYLLWWVFKRIILIQCTSSTVSSITIPHIFKTGIFQNVQWTPDNISSSTEKLKKTFIYGPKLFWQKQNSNMLSFISAGYYTHQGLLSWLNEELSDNFKESLACDISSWLWEVFSRLGLKQGKVQNFPKPFLLLNFKTSHSLKKKKCNAFLIGR